MNGIINNINLYHITSLIFGVLFFYIASVSFNMFGEYYNSLIQLYNPQPSQFTIIVINFVMSFVSSIIPSIVIIIITHFILRPKTRFFLFALSVSFLALSTYNGISIASYYQFSGYLIGILAKSAGSLFVLWLLVTTYLKLMPNKQINADQKPVA